MAIMENLMRKEDNDWMKLSLVELRDYWMSLPPYLTLDPDDDEVLRRRAISSRLIELLDDKYPIDKTIYKTEVEVPDGMPGARRHRIKLYKDLYLRVMDGDDFDFCRKSNWNEFKYKELISGTHAYEGTYRYLVEKADEISNGIIDAMENKDFRDAVKLHQMEFDLLLEMRRFEDAYPRYVIIKVPNLTVRLITQPRLKFKFKDPYFNRSKIPGVILEVEAAIAKVESYRNNWYDDCTGYTTVRYDTLQLLNRYRNNLNWRMYNSPDMGTVTSFYG